MTADHALAGCSVVVIGGSSGMGLATARAAQAQGARVTIAARDEQRLDAARQDLGGAANARRVDAGDDQSVAELFRRTGEVDHVVSFAGSLAFGRVVDTAAPDLRDGMQSRFWGAAHLCKHARLGDGGSITLCSGIAGMRPRPGRAVGAASTSGVEALTRAMALELAPVRVNAVCPGVIDTPMADSLLGDRKAAVYAATARGVPLGRIGAAEDAAHAVMFLMTAAWVTGTVVVVDGGYTRA